MPPGARVQSCSSRCFPGGPAGRGAGRQWQQRGASPLCSFGRSAGGGCVCTAGESRRGHCFQDAGEERRGAHARRLPPPQAWPAPGPPQQAGLTLAAGRSHGASARVASLPARTRPECGVVIVTLRSGGASRRSRSRCGSRCPRLGRAGCRPGGALTSPPCSAPVLPPPPLYTSSVCGAHLLLAKGACAAGRPDSSQSAPPLRLRPPLPPRCVCTTAEARRANAGSPGLGVEIKQTMTFPFPSRLSQVKTHLKTTSVVSDPAHPGQ